MSENMPAHKQYEHRQIVTPQCEDGEGVTSLSEQEVEELIDEMAFKQMVLDIGKENQFIHTQSGITFESGYALLQFQHGWEAHADALREE